MMPARRKDKLDPVRALAEARVLGLGAATLHEVVARKPGILVDQKVRKSSAAGLVRKPDISLEGKVRKTDVRSRVGKSDVNQVDVRKADISPVDAMPPGKTDIENTIARNVHRLGRSVRRSAHPYASMYTQQEVADALRVSRQAVIEIERGRRKVSAAELVLAAKFFGVPVTELLP